MYRVSSRHQKFVTKKSLIAYPFHDLLFRPTSPVGFPYTSNGNFYEFTDLNYKARMLDITEHASKTNATNNRCYVHVSHFDAALWPLTIGLYIGLRSHCGRY